MAMHWALEKRFKPYDAEGPWPLCERCGHGTQKRAMFFDRVKQASMCAKCVYVTLTTGHTAMQALYTPAALLVAALLFSGCAHTAMLCFPVTVGEQAIEGLWCGPTSKKPEAPEKPAKKPDAWTRAR